MALQFSRRCGKNVAVKDGGLVVERKNDKFGYRVAFTNRPLWTTERFEVVLLQDDPLMSLGITTWSPEEVRIPQYISELTPSWMMSLGWGTGGDVRVNGRAVQKVLSGDEVKALKKGDKLALMVTPERELIFFVSGKQVATTTITTEAFLFGFVELYGFQGEIVRLIPGLREEQVQHQHARVMAEPQFESANSRVSDLQQKSAAVEREKADTQTELTVQLQRGAARQEAERKKPICAQKRTEVKHERRLSEDAMKKASLRQPLQLLESEHRHLQQQLQESERQQEGLLELLQDSERQKDELQQQLYARESQRDRLQQQLLERESQRDRLQQQLLERESQRDRLQQQLLERESQQDGLQQQLQQRNREQLEFQRELQRVQTENQQLTEQHQTESQQLRATIDQLRQQIASLQVPRVLQQTHHTEFWEVPRGDVTLNMQRILGTGGWGYVVEGRFCGQTVAVKCLHDLIREPAFTAVIRREIGIMTQLRHPNLVLLIAAVIDEEVPLIITELLELSLRRAYERNRLDAGERCKLSIFRDVASALNYLHLHHHGPIIHRDVSSANVLLESRPKGQWRAKLSDFGSAKLAREAITTGPGAAVYSAPEVRRDTGIRQSPKVDVYSYGVLLCEVGVGQFPLEGRFPAMMQSLAQRGPLLHRLVSSCTQELPDNRPSMADILADLDRAPGN